MKWSGGSTLSVHRAFVVHLGAGGPGRRRRLCGRVEHLSSGRTTHFASLKDLLTFFAAVLDDPPPPGRNQAPRRGEDTPPFRTTQPGRRRGIAGAPVAPMESRRSA